VIIGQLVNYTLISETLRFSASEKIKMKLVLGLSTTDR